MEPCRETQCLCFASTCCHLTVAPHRCDHSRIREQLHELGDRGVAQHLPNLLSLTIVVALCQCTTPIFPTAFHTSGDRMSHGNSANLHRVGNVFPHSPSMIFMAVSFQEAVEVYATDVLGRQAKLHVATPFPYLPVFASLQYHLSKILEEVLDARVLLHVLDQDVRDGDVFLDQCNVCLIVQKPRSIPSQK